MFKVYCRNCGEAVPKGSSFCSYCGVESPGASPLAAHKPAPRPAPRAQAPARQSRGTQGLVLGGFGSIFGVLGIFLLGLIFVPLSALLSLFGLLRGLSNPNAAGILVSSAGMALAVIGFFTSPSLMLLTGGALVASQMDEPQPSSNNMAANSRVYGAPERPAVPEDQNEFCRIIDTATAEYISLAGQAKAAGEAKNGIVQARMNAAMTEVAKKRNADVFRFVQGRRFVFSDWQARIVKIESPYNGTVVVSVRPRCSDTITMHVRVPVDHTFFDQLSTKRQGDELVVSASFIHSVMAADGRVNMPTTDDQLEGSITESGSMREPEYRALVGFTPQAAQAAPPPQKAPSRAAKP